jgi:hypothetical protein
VSKQDLWQGVLYLHLLATAFFVGGQLVFGIAVLPILGQDSDREKLRAVARLHTQMFLTIGHPSVTQL